MGVQKIGRYGFYNCRNLEELWFSSDFTDLGSGAFTGCQRRRAGTEDEMADGSGRSDSYGAGILEGAYCRRSHQRDQHAFYSDSSGDGGNVCSFTAGSILVLKAMKKHPGFYYKKKAFYFCLRFKSIE